MQKKYYFCAKIIKIYEKNPSVHLFILSTYASQFM